MFLFVNHVSTKYKYHHGSLFFKRYLTTQHLDTNLSVNLDNSARLCSKSNFLKFWIKSSTETYIYNTKNSIIYEVGMKMIKIFNEWLS